MLDLSGRAIARGLRSLSLDQCASLVSLVASFPGPIALSLRACPLQCLDVSR